MLRSDEIGLEMDEESLEKKTEGWRGIWYEASVSKDGRTTNFEKMKRGKKKKRVLEKKADGRTTETLKQ